MHLRRAVIVTVALAALQAACARGMADGAGTGDTGDDSSGDGDGSGTPDGGGGGLPDGGHLDPPDADTGGGPVTITHSSSMSLEGSTGVSCQSDFGNKRNSWYRLFDLPAMGITGQVDVTQVTIGVQEASSFNGDQPVTVKLHRLQGAFVIANLTELGRAKIDVPDEELQLHDIPLSAAVPAGSTLVAEILVPNGEIDGNYFFPGANNDGQTGPTYVRSECGDANQPTDIATLGFPDFHLVLAVDGVEQ